jgi:RNA polymerase sigma factor (sigma-70 family)
MGWTFWDHKDRLERFRRGERAVLERVYRVYVARVEALVRRQLSARRVSTRIAEQWEDVVQEAFAHAFSRRAREAYDGTRDYGPYLLAITRNVVADLLRTGAREVTTGDDPIEHRLALEAASSFVADQPHWNDPETVARARGYLAKLSDELQSVHYQRYVLGKAQAAAARSLGMSRRRVRTLEKRLSVGLMRELGGTESRRRS